MEQHRGRKTGIKPWMERKNNAGRRLDASPARITHARQQGTTAEQAPRRRERRRIRQMAVSAMLLMLLVTVKLAFPDVMERYRQQMLRLLGENTDFTSAFAAAGKAVSPDGTLGDAISDVYTAVFGAQQIEEPNHDETKDETHFTEEGEVVYTAANTPELVSLTQQVLGFAYASPLHGEITSGFGYREHPILDGEKFHFGMDIAADSGEVIRSFADGTVTVVAESSDLGKYVIISHGDGFTTLYAHCSVVTASSGQQVALGDPIAEVGDTGMTTGPHLHFELMHGSVFLDPVYYAAP